MVDYLKLWTRSIEELLVKLKNTQPGEGMIGEVFYWRDLARVLEAVTEEIRQPFVEVIIQILQSASEEDANKVFAEDVSTFLKEKARIIKGLKEAKWNNKYMKIIEKPVKTIEQAIELKDILLNISALMNSLSNIFMSSNFYKENRILSFIDRMLDIIQSKLRKQVSLQQALVHASNQSFDKFNATTVVTSLAILDRFQEHFFLKSNKLTDKNEEAKMGQSFYRKDGLDFLAFSYGEGFYKKANVRVFSHAEKIEQQVGYWLDLIRFY